VAVGTAAAHTQKGMDFELSHEQQLLQSSVREFCERHVIDQARTWDEEERFPAKVIQQMGEMGLMGMLVPESLGGTGMSLVDYVVALEEVARADGSVGLTMASHNSLGTGHIALAGTPEQKAEFVPRLARGEILGAWGLTEPGSGSDAGAAATRAIKRETSQGTQWVLNGTKTFITQGSVAEVYVILASTTPEKKQRGLTAFILRKGQPGFRCGRHIEKMGLRASDTTELVMEDVVVPDSMRLGAVDQGFYDTLQILDKGRIGIGAWAIGIASAAFDAALTYARDRVQFGRPIATFGGIENMLADMDTELTAARLLIRRAAWMVDEGQSCNREASVGKLFAAQTAKKVCDLAIQIHGGYGYTREFPVERYYRDVRLAEIGEGTNEVQKLIIARSLVEEMAADANPNQPGEAAEA